MNFNNDDWIIPSPISSILQSEAAIAENESALTNAQLQIIYTQKWFQLFVPKAYYGLEFSLPDALRLEESLARIDGSLGWTVTLCAGAGLFAGYVKENLAKMIFTDKKVCFGGSGGNTGIAKKNKKGYEVTGHWKYASGSPHNTIFTANCKIEENGKILCEADCKPEIRSFLFFRKEVQLYNSWHMMGLKATASDSFSVHCLQVEEDRCFNISQNSATHPQAIYKYPFLQFAESTLAVNLLGMAEHFVEECKALIQKENHHSLLSDLIIKEATTRLATVKSHYYDAVNFSWYAHVQNSETSNEKDFQKVSTASRFLAKEARLTVSGLYPLCGMIAADQSSILNRIWRDIHTASQHSLLAS